MTTGSNDSGLQSTLTADEKLRMRRDLAASSMRQVSRLFRQQAMVFGMSKEASNQMASAAESCTALANKIERGTIDERDWSFLCYLKG